MIYIACWIAQTSQPQKTKNVEIYRRHQKELKPGVLVPKVDEEFSPFCIRWTKCILMRETGNDNLIWHLFSKYGGKVHVLANMPLNRLWTEKKKLRISTEMAPENQFYNAKMKIYKETVFHRLVNLFTLRFLCFIVRPWDCPQNHDSHGKTVRLERSETLDLY